MPFVLKVLGLVFMTSRYSMVFGVILGGSTIGTLEIFPHTTYYHNEIIYPRAHGSICCISPVGVWGNQLKSD